MPKALNQMVREIKGEMRRTNPAPDPGTMLQEKLINSGRAESYTDEQLEKALKAIGVPPEERNGWYEELASWL